MKREATIYFDPTEHKYTDENGNVYTSVTTLLGKYKPYYDKEFWAMYRTLEQSGYKVKPNLKARKIYVQGGAIRPQWYSIDLLFTGIIPTTQSINSVLGNWKQISDEACHYGTEKHEVLEHSIHGLYKDYVLPTQITSAKYDAKIETIDDLANYSIANIDIGILNMLKSLIVAGYTLYAEYRVYSWEHLVSGTIDLLAINSKGEFIIIDWKTNKDEIRFESGYYRKEWNASRTEKITTNEWVNKPDDRLLSPLTNYCNSKGVLYGLQLALYAYICEMWGLVHKSSCLVHIRRKTTNTNKPIFKDDGTHDFHTPVYYNFKNTDYKEAAKAIMEIQQTHANRTR